MSSPGLKHRLSYVVERHEERVAAVCFDGPPSKIVADPAVAFLGRRDDGAVVELLDDVVESPRVARRIVDVEKPARRVDARSFAVFFFRLDQHWSASVENSLEPSMSRE